MFLEYLYLQEALRLVKKGSEVEDSDSNSEKIGRFQNKDVFRTTHTKDVRDKTKVIRDEGITNKDYIDILKKGTESTGKALEAGKIYNINFKNSQGKYDMLIASVFTDKIIIVTILQQSRNSPNYFSKPEDIKLIAEMNNTEIIELQAL